MRRARRFLIRALRWAARRLESGSLPGSGLMPEPAPGWAPPALPTWVEDEIQALAPMEHELLPPGSDCTRYAFYSVPSDPIAGHYYFRLLQQLPRTEYDVVFLVPWLKPGGADRGTLHHMRALLEINPELRILVLATEPAKSPWLERVPFGIDVVQSGLLSEGVDFQHQVAAITRLLVQIQPKVVHNINSRVGWDSIKQHGLALRQTSILLASLFCDDYTPAGVAVGYARDFLRDTYEHLDTVFCDNTVYPRIWNRELGVPLATFTVLPFPYDGVIPAANDQSAKGASADRPRVLWAGRFDRQKRPDVLLAIARRMQDVMFDVHGASVLSHSPLPELVELRALPNVKVYDAFSDFRDIVRPDHCAYLMTTSWEGLPTILLDAFANGLPVIAPPVGGITDLVPESQLVSHPDDVDGYVDLLRRFIDDPSDRNVTSKRQLEELANERSWAMFVARMRSLGYFNETAESPLVGA